MRVEIHPKIRVRENGKIDVIITRLHFETVEDTSNQCDAFRSCRSCPHAPRGRMVERLHHKEALARGSYWITVKEGCKYPKECIFSIDELVAQNQDDDYCTSFPGRTVWTSLMELS